jgi:putative hydrolase of the HAD superfamily
MLAHFGIEPRRAAFFEDMARNLTPAHKIGMKTVLVLEEGEDGVSKMNMPEKYRQQDDTHIDVTTGDLTSLLNEILTAL